MSEDTYKKLKRQNGEAFARTLRNFHGGILEIPGIVGILRHAGRDATPLLPYLMSLLAANDNTSVVELQDPFVLLARAGYKAFHANTLKKQNSIQKYFRPGELLCTFRDHSRYEKYHIVHAVKEGANKIQRSDFLGREDRQDAYGTSVISIQMLKDGGFISIKNRYNHTVSGCDNTFDSNPDNIIPGLSVALKTHFNVAFEVRKVALPEGYVLMGNGIFKYHEERGNIYYGDQAWAADGEIHAADRAAGDALFEGFLFDNKNKKLKKIDPQGKDSFDEDFNRDYGGNPGLCVRDGNLMLGDEILIGAERSRIKTISLPALKSIGPYCLEDLPVLTHFSAPALTSMGRSALKNVPVLEHFHAPSLVSMGERCLHNAPLLTEFVAPSLESMKQHVVYYANALTVFSAPLLTSMDNRCLYFCESLTSFDAPALTEMDYGCLLDCGALVCFDAPALVSMGHSCLKEAKDLLQISVPVLTVMGDGCLENAYDLLEFSAPALVSMGKDCLGSAMDLKNFSAPVLTSMDDGCLKYVQGLRRLSVPALVSMGNQCINCADNLSELSLSSLETMGNECFHVLDMTREFVAPALQSMGDECFSSAENLSRFRAPALKAIGAHCFSHVPLLTVLPRVKTVAAHRPAPG